ncbi:hypothetical protein V1511DRAFT_493888 [Dipodascopsis uninucleata]
MPLLSLGNYSSFLMISLLVVGTSALSVTGTLAYQAYDREQKLKKLKESLEPTINPSPSISRQSSQSNESLGPIKVSHLNRYGAPEVHSMANITEESTENMEKWDPTLIDEQLARNRAFLGEKGLQKVRNAFVVVVGCGGVGSWVITMLVRSGIGKVRIIDFDQVTLSSLNRHASATLADVGTPKALSLRNYLKTIAPWVEIDARVELWNNESAEELLSDSPTIVVDAIDNIDTKVDLLTYCHSHKLPVISAMGAACKADPTRIQIDDISGSAEDPLARATRRRLRLRGIVSNITVVFSSEKPGPDKAALLPLDEDIYQQGKVEELGVLQDFRARILPVLGTMPGIFGLAIATFILTKIGEYPVEEYIVGRNRVKTYDSVLHQLAGQKMRLEGSQKLPIDVNDVGYLVEEVFRGRSVVSRESGGNRIALTKWLKTGGWTCDNLVLMTREEVKKHEQRVLKGNENIEDIYPPSVLDLVRKRFDEEKAYSKYR